MMLRLQLGSFKFPAARIIMLGATAFSVIVSSEAPPSRWAETPNKRQRGGEIRTMRCVLQSSLVSALGAAMPPTRAPL